jgi:hypothetical protein
MLSQAFYRTFTEFVSRLREGKEKSVVMLVRMEENSATLTPFGSLIRISPARVSVSRSWTAKLRAVLALLFR